MCCYIFWELNFLIAVLHVLHVPAKMGARQQWWPSPSTHIRELYCGFWEGPAPERCTTTESNTTTPASSSPVSWKRGWQRNATNSLRWRMESFVLLISAVEFCCSWIQNHCQYCVRGVLMQLTITWNIWLIDAVTSCLSFFPRLSEEIVKQRRGEEQTERHYLKKEKAGGRLPERGSMILLEPEEGAVMHLKSRT